jgi:hypothetical protein
MAHRFRLLFSNNKWYAKSTKLGVSITDDNKTKLIMKLRTTYGATHARMRCNNLILSENIAN